MDLRRLLFVPSSMSTITKSTSSLSPQSSSPRRINILSLFTKCWFSRENTITLVYVYFIFSLLYPNAYSSEPHIRSVHDDKGDKAQWAKINITFRDRDNKEIETETFGGVFGMKSEIHSVSGTLMHSMSLTKTLEGRVLETDYGCTKYNNPAFPAGKWIALVQRGNCNFTRKIHQATDPSKGGHNASAVIIYNNASDTLKKSPTIMNHAASGTISVFIEKADGLRIAKLLDSGVRVDIVITPTERQSYPQGLPSGISKTSVLFVSISFIVLMFISLAWLLFYYIQRFRYSHAKERLARRLACAAKKAIAKTPQKTVKPGDRELETDFDQCAVCIEPYKAQDVIRILPCRHVFHKSCVDPWLLDQRSCPMCKLDILRAYGMQIGGSQESVPVDTEVGVAPQNTVNEEQEMSSSVEEVQQSEQVKVLLVPHTCLHYLVSPDGGLQSSRADEEAGPSCSLVGASAVGEDATASQTSTPKHMPRATRAEKVDEEHDEQEMAALISESPELQISSSGTAGQARQEAEQVDQHVEAPGLA